MTNPLLEDNYFPDFSKIQPEHILPAIESIIRDNTEVLAEQLASLKEPTWCSLIEPHNERENRLNCAWSPVSHLNNVYNSDDLREVYSQCLKNLTEYNTALNQNVALYRAYKYVQQQESFKSLSAAQKKSIGNVLRDFELAGVALPENERQRYGEIQAQLTALNSEFANHVLDATQNWFKHVLNKNELSGLPESTIAAAKQVAERKNLEGYVLTLDGPVYLTVMMQADNRVLRQEMYTAYATRASDQGPQAGKWDNTALMEEILSLRQELAKLLGFSDYSELSLAKKMAATPEQVLDFLTGLAEKTYSLAENELAELSRYAWEALDIEELQAWDISYCAEKLKQQKFNISQERVREYFPLETVLAGLFELAERLFNISITLQKGVDVWHGDVKVYRIMRGEEIVAYFYLDVFAREHKRGGAWVADCRVRCKMASQTQLPAAFITCNFNEPTAEQPTLLSHMEVITLFHEFGHGLHHMLTKIDVPSVSGIRGVAWDAVELPSQFLENWCWQKPILQFLSTHYQTQQPLPDNMIDSLVAAKNFHSAMQMLRQIEFALFDFRLHREYGSDGFVGIQTLLDEVRQQVSVVSPPSFNRFQHSFTHIFAGGYAAGYYSYKWAEVLSADAFSLFEEQGLFDKATAEAFLQEILEKGGSEDAMVLFKNFRGREPSTEALLRYSGII